MSSISSLNCSQFLVLRFIFLQELEVFLDDASRGLLLLGNISFSEMLSRSRLQLDDLRQPLTRLQYWAWLVRGYSCRSITSQGTLSFFGRRELFFQLRSFRSRGFVKSSRSRLYLLSSSPFRIRDLRSLSGQSLLLMALCRTRSDVQIILLNLSLIIVSAMTKESPQHEAHHAEHTEHAKPEQHAAQPPTAVKPNVPKMNWDPRESWRVLSSSFSNLSHKAGGWKNSLIRWYHKAETKAGDFYDNTPVRLANFKRDYILKLGDERVRLIILSVLSIPLWKVSNYRSTSSTLLKSRNLALTFVGLGMILSPEIFNPFLHEVRAPSEIKQLKLHPAPGK